MFLTRLGVKWRGDNQVPLGDLDRRHDRLGEGIKKGVAGSGIGHFDQVACAVIEERRDRADADATFKACIEINEVGVVEIVLVVRLGQAVAVDEERNAIELFGLDRKSVV